MPDYSAFDWGQKEEQQPDTGLFGDFDWSDESTPGAPEAPQVSQEVVEDVTAQPVGRPPEPEAPAEPAAPQEVDSMYPELNEVQQEAAKAADRLALNPYVTGGNYGTNIEKVQAQAKLVSQAKMSSEGRAAAQEFIREEAMPVVGGTLGTIMAAGTGGTSMLMSMALTAGATGVGAGMGEGLEQTLKMKGYMPTAANETRPTDAWDILERSAWRGGEEAMWSLIPDMLVRGTGYGFRKMLLAGAKKSVDVSGAPLDIGRRGLIDLMKNYAAKRGQNAEDMLLTSDVVETGLLKGAEDVATNSYFDRIPLLAPRSAKGIRETQSEAIKEEITEVVSQYMDPAAGYVKENVQGAISSYIRGAFTHMNDFAVAGLVNMGFKQSQKVQESVAKSMYAKVGAAMDVTRMETVYKEVELPIMGLDGKPMTTMQVVQQERPAFPVNLEKVIKIGEDRMDILNRTNAPIDSQTAELMNFPMESDFEAVGQRLIDMKRDSRTLGKSTAEGSGKQKMILDNAIREIEAAMDETAQAAADAGIVTPDGRSIYELKKEADAIWKEKVEDFQNSYIAAIIKETKPKNGAPEKLGQLFIKNETAAYNIMKVLDDSKKLLTGDELEQVLQAENAIKGSIVEEIFMPFDSTSGKYLAPDTTPLVAKEKELRKIFGDEAYDELRKLGAAIDHHAGTNMSNYLGFAQRARETGTIMGTLRGMLNANLQPLIRDGGGTLLFSLGAGRMLTSPKMIRQARTLFEPDVSPAVKTSIAQWLIHRTYEYQQGIEASLTPEERERMEATMEDRKEADHIRKGM